MSRRSAQRTPRHRSHRSQEARQPLLDPVDVETLCIGDPLLEGDRAGFAHGMADRRDRGREDREQHQGWNRHGASGPPGK
jgi:hypothetical protein